MTTALPLAATDLAALADGLPYLLESRHVMEVTRKKRDAALRAMKQGEFGPCTKLGGKYVVFRDLAIKALLERALPLPQETPARRPSSERAKHYATRLGAPRGQERHLT